MKTKYQAQQNKRRDNDFYLMVEMKLERLVAALYLVSNFFSDTEPMKWKFRDIGLSMLTDISQLKDTSMMNRTEILTRTLSNSVTIMSLLEIARLSDFVTDMNYGILRREFVSFSNMIRSRDEVNESMSELELSDDFFNMVQSQTEQPRPVKQPQQKPQHVFKPVSHTPVEEFVKVQLPSEVPTKKVVLPQNTDTKVAVNIPVVIEKPTTQNEVSPYVQQAQTKLPEIEKTVDNRETSPRVVEKKSYRRNVILDVLRTKQELSIKDISTIVTDCSEKTIQRELLGMVEEGLLTKTGERRWSRYSLAAI